MRALFDYIVEPVGSRYDNTVQTDNGDLILNTSISDHTHVNRYAKVMATPMKTSAPIKVGDEVIVNHNIFRRWYNMKGEEKNSRSFIGDNKYLAQQDQVYMYRRPGGKWRPVEGYCFIEPIGADDRWAYEKYKQLVGFVRYTDGAYAEDAMVGFRPGSEYEFYIDGMRLYRVFNKAITTLYTHIYGYDRDQAEDNCGG